MDGLSTAVVKLKLKFNRFEVAMATWFYKNKAANESIKFQFQFQ